MQNAFNFLPACIQNACTKIKHGITIANEDCTVPPQELESQLFEIKEKISSQQQHVRTLRPTRRNPDCQPPPHRQVELALAGTTLQRGADHSRTHRPQG
jgi:hypothetical protein